MQSYCVREKKQTECVEPSGYINAKNGWLMFFCTCASCDITKNKFVKNNAQTRGFLDVGNSHFISEMLFKGATTGLINLGRMGAAKAVKSEFSKKKVKGMVDKYIGQALDGFRTDLSKKLDPLHRGSGYDMRMYARESLKEIIRRINIW